MPADSVAKATTPEPMGKGGRNWITKLRPGNKGELPPYIQHIAKALMTKRGMSKDQAYRVAVSAPKRWLHSRHTDAGTKAASTIATGEWEKDRALNRLKRVGGAVATHAAEVAPSVLDTAAVFESESEMLEVLEQGLGKALFEAALGRVQWMEGLPISPREHALDQVAERAAEALTLVEATRIPRERDTGRWTNYLKRISSAPSATHCPKCGALKIADKMCPACEAPLAGKRPSLAEAAVLVVQERNIPQAKRKQLLAKGQAIKNSDGSIAYPIETVEDLKSAATLARTGHGDVPAAKRLIGKMSKKLGVSNPLSEAVADPIAAERKRGEKDTADRMAREHKMGMHDPRPKAECKECETRAVKSLKEQIEELREHDRPKIRTSSGRVHYIGKGGRAGGVILACSGRHIGLGGAIPTDKPVDCPTCKRKAEAGTLREAEIDGVKPTGHSGTLARVKALKLGETARLPDGLAITHAATDDGRKTWRADTPARWSSSGWSLGDARRSPDDAVKDAFTKSASSSDPASLGGTQRFHSYSRVQVGGKEHRFLGVDPNSAKPEVRDVSGTGQPGSIKTVAWSELHPPDDIMREDDGGGVLGSMLDSRMEEAARGRRASITSIVGSGGPKDTMDLHRKGGKFSKGRAQIHGQMVRHVLDNPRAHEAGTVAMVVTRSPAGGNVHTVKGAGGAVPHDAMHVSIPAMRQSLPEHAALDAHPKGDPKKQTDREARHVAKVASTMALMRGKSVVVHDDPRESK